MKSLVSEEVINKLNDLLAKFFKANSFGDNLVYWLQQENYVNIADIYHHKVAHWFTGDQGADYIGDIIYKLNGRALRKGFDGDTGNFKSVEKAFADNLGLFENLADETSRIIEELDFNYKNKYIVIKLETMLEILQEYVKVSIIWYEKVKLYTEKDKLYALDKDFHTFAELPE